MHILSIPVDKKRWNVPFLDVRPCFSKLSFAQESGSDTTVWRIIRILIGKENRKLQGTKSCKLSLFEEELNLMAQLVVADSEPTQYLMPT